MNKRVIICVIAALILIIACVLYFAPTALIPDKADINMIGVFGGGFPENISEDKVAIIADELRKAEMHRLIRFGPDESGKYVVSAAYVLKGKVCHITINVFESVSIIEKRTGNSTSYYKANGPDLYTLLESMY